MGALLFCALGASVAWLVLRLIQIGRRESYLPSGPPTVPILGNLNSFPKLKAYLKLTEWARIYGGIYSLKMGPGTMIVLTDMTIVKDLMEKRSQATADRPAAYIPDLVTGGMNLGLARYNEDWRTMRRVSHGILAQKACVNHIPIQSAESTQLLYECLMDPKGFYTHIRRYSTSVIFSVLYGKRIPRFETEEIRDYFEMVDMWGEMLAPGALPPVDLLPFLKYLPPSLASWKAKCKTVRRLQRNVYFGLLSETENRLAQGHENGCFMEQVLARQSEFGMSREQVGYLGGVMIDGGSDTTSSWIQTLVLALVAFPDAQKKAQAELDQVVGYERKPTPEDFPHLPYVQAVIKECHRWRPIAPLALPHATIEDIDYRGFRIPSGTTILINTWGMTQDPEVFERPEDFWPDRWLASNEFDVDNSDVRNNTWFGSGRRFCPGVHLADNSLMVNTMNLLWAFNFEPEMDPETGKPLPPDLFNYIEGVAIAPAPFQCTITPRSPHHIEIIKHDFVAAEGTFSLYEHGLSEEDRAFVQAQRK